MDNSLRGVEPTIRDLEQSLRAVERRVALLEQALAASGHATPTDALPQAAGLGESILPPASWRTHDLVTILSFIGRTFVALGGAYLLRALTDSAVLPQPAGVALGLAYAVLWLAMADRAGAAHSRVSAAFHGLVAAIIAFPLLWEAVTRFHLIGPGTAAAALATMTALALGVALRQRLQVLAWIALVPALVTLFALVAATGVVLPFAVAAIVLAVGMQWTGYGADWVLLRWPAALVADVMVLALIARVSSRSWPDRPEQIIAVQLLLLTGHVASVVTRTLVRGRDVNVFEVLQTAAALAIGFGGAVYVAQATGFGATILAAINLAVGAGCYGVAFAFVARRQGLRRNFYFYTSLGLILVLVSTALLFHGAMVGVMWTALAVLTSWLALRVGRTALNLHAAVYVIAAAGASGLLSTSATALAGSVDGPWAPLSTIALVVLAGALVCWAIPTSPAADLDGVYARVARLLIAIVVVWSAGGWMVGVLSPPLAGAPGHGADAGVIATVRTSVLAAAALVLAWAGRHTRFRESAWLLFPVLIAGGLKLLVEDLPRSRPATLFIALALYGGALIIAPRIGRVSVRTAR
jgi:hypothetical protein